MTISAHTCNADEGRIVNNDCAVTVIAFVAAGAAGAADVAVTAAAPISHSSISESAQAYLVAFFARALLAAIF